jgi:multiple sugar transport system permease protein
MKGFSMRCRTASKRRPGSTVRVWGAFTRVTLPLAAPGPAATAILCFILSWNDFFFALILTRTEAMTAPVAIVNFMQYAGFEWNKLP